MPERFIRCITEQTVGGVDRGSERIGGSGLFDDQRTHAGKQNMRSGHLVPGIVIGARVATNSDPGVDEAGVIDTRLPYCGCTDGSVSQREGEDNVFAIFHQGPDDTVDFHPLAILSCRKQLAYTDPRRGRRADASDPAAARRHDRQWGQNRRGRWFL